MSDTDHQKDPSDLMYQLTKLGVLTVADPTAPALWVPGVKDATAFSANFAKEQRKTLRATVAPRLKALSAQVAAKHYQSPLPAVSDLWQAAAGTSYPGHRFAVVRELIGWSQEVISNELGKSNASALSNFECNPGARLGYLSDACSVIDVDEHWVLTGIAASSPLEAPSMPWLLPWWQATVEAHDFCDQLIQRSDEDHVDIIQNKNQAAALARWLKNPGTIRPRPQPWWEKQGSLLSWFVEASATYGNEHRFTCAFTETSIRDLQAIVADWISLRAHLRRITGLEEVLRNPSRVITDEQAKQVLAFFGRKPVMVKPVHRTAGEPSGNQSLPTDAAAMDAVMKILVPPQAGVVLAQTGSPENSHRFQVNPLVRGIKPKSKRGRPAGRRNTP